MEAGLIVLGYFLAGIFLAGFYTSLWDCDWNREGAFFLWCLIVCAWPAIVLTDLGNRLAVWLKGNK